MTDKRKESTLAIPSGAKAKPSIPCVPMSDVDAISQAVSASVSASLNGQLSSLSLEVTKMGEKLTGKIEDLGGRVDSQQRQLDKHDKELAELRRLAEAQASARSATNPAPMSSSNLASGAPQDERKFVVGSWEHLSRRDLLIERGRKLLLDNEQEGLFTDIQAPKRGQVIFVWFKEHSHGVAFGKRLREAKLPSPAGRTFWCAPSKSSAEVSRSSALGRAAARIREHLDDASISTDTLDVLWRQGQIAYGKSVVAAIGADNVVVLDRAAWDKELKPMEAPSL
eukprot:6492232-Amphidinium_carterae.2